MSENLTIPGFRKGKAPRPIVEKHLGTDRIKQRALDILLPGIFADVISENQLDLVTEPVVDSYEFELGKPVSLTAKLEVKPEVNLPDYKGQTVEVPEFKIEEDAIDKQIENILNRYAKLEQVIDRATESTDIVFMDFEGSIDGEPIKNGAGKKKHGKSGEDLALNVPVGTVVSIKAQGEKDELVADLEKPDQSVVVARGGKGGMGNTHFTSSTNQTPELAQKGEPGEENSVVLEMRLIADVGIVGYPNAGKST